MNETATRAAKRSRPPAPGSFISPAGRGERKAALRAAGVQCFIYDGCDALATLPAAYDILGAENG